MNSRQKILFILLRKSTSKLDFFRGSLDVDSLFTNTPLEETIGICTNILFKESETVEDLSKSEFK